MPLLLVALLFELALRAPLAAATAAPLAVTLTASPTVTPTVTPVTPRREDASPLVGGKPRSRALVVALHGGSWTGLEPRALAERMLRELDGEARRAGLRLIVPIAPSPGSGDEWQVPWLLPEGEALVLRLIADELETGRVDARRVHLAGHGAGATGALHLASRHPELIAGVAAWSGTPAPVWDQDRIVVGLLDDPVNALRDVSVYVWTGTDDEQLDRAALGLLTSGLSRQRTGRQGRPLLIESGEGGHGYGPGPRTGLRFLEEQRKPARR